MSATVNGASPEATRLADAIASEQALAERAADIRGDAIGIDAELFLKLLSLLREPIPAGFIKSIGVVKGKPYESTGVSSVQVQISRMDNVLTPLGWRESITYHAEGKVACVVVSVVTPTGEVLASRESWGGVNQASTLGNLHKGSYTNAAKVAFARLGPGHEVYVGAADFDPDVHLPSAEAQDRAPRAPASRPAGDVPLNAEQRTKIVKAFEEAGVDDDELVLFLTNVGADSTDDLTIAQAFQLRELLDAKAGRA